MWKNRIRAAMVLAAIRAAGIGGGLAFAGDTQDEAEKLIHHGVELRKARDDEAAARAFQKAYDLIHTPRAAGQLGLAKQALGLWEEAERYVGEAVRATTEDAWVTKNRAVLDESLGTIQKHLGRIKVIGDPEGADVAVNGRLVGKLPLVEPVRVSAGVVDIDVHAPGYVATQRTVTLVGGQYQQVVMHLTKVEVPKADDATPAVDTHKEGTLPTGPSAPAVDTARGTPSGTRIALKWTAAGLAAAGLVTGVVGVALHSSNVSKFDNHPCRNKDGAGVLTDGTPDTTCQSLLDSFRTDNTVAIVGFVAAGAFAAAWLALLLTEPPPAAGLVEHAARQPLCAPSLGAVGLSCVGSF